MKQFKDLMVFLDMTSNNTTELIGYIGAGCLTITLIPQLYHTIKTQRVNDISYGFITLQITTCIFFLIYGLLLKENPLILANSIVLFQLILFLFLKIKYNQS